MPKPKATAIDLEALEAYVTRPEKAVARHMVGIVYKDHARITKLATALNTTKGRVVSALLDYYDETE